MTRRLHIYIPDEFVDLGLVGEHPIRFVSEILNYGPESRQEVIIVEAEVQINYQKCNAVQRINVLGKLREDSYELRKWEDEILEDYKRRNECDEDEREGA